MSKLEVVWEGPVGRKSGTGIASREYVQALRRQGVSVKVGAAKHSKLLPLGGRRPLIYHRTADTISFSKLRPFYKPIILNTVWETTRMPTRWRSNINKFDAVFIPSMQNKRALRASGVKVPIYVVPHGVHTKKYRPGNKKFALAEAKGRFVFVSVFGFQHRKNPEGLLRAYWEQFSAKDKVLLVIKTNGYSSGENEQWIKNKIASYKKKLGIRKQTAPITVIGRHLSERQVAGIYTLGDAFVLPTRGEGVGLPFLESLASGTPVIATGWGGHMDFLSKRNSFLVNYKLTNPSARMGGKHGISRSFRHLFAESGQQWAEADIGSLKRQMKYAFDHPMLCKKKGRQGIRDVRGMTWGRSGAAMKRAVRQVLGKG
ncbi:glycosyltransferase [Paenibacillus harenae]|uniref:glycosyltransferase n=1 Tax=Paenibacillus harenae TaxID=306543 RepID=UPI0027902EFF|nr:glycosyltransferase [Paenibacillus harenae]MDQ0061775.1 glycosyltransferase involved in cell wall biosynthesis [Paenibacillus harenae]